MAIRQQEGWFKGSTSERNHNPGNLKASSPNQPQDNRGFRIFKSDLEGWHALINQVNINMRRGLNLYEFFGGKEGVYPGYANKKSGNDPRAYAEFVAKLLGISPTATLSAVQ
jgi:hypothetical protein